MAKTKTKKPSSASKPAAPAEPDAPKAVPASRADKVLTSLAADQPALTAVQREAFSARYAGAACEALGGKTKSESVLGDAVAWAPIMDKALRKHPAALRRYSRARFAWFLSCARALDAARAEQQGRGGAAAASKARAQQAEAAALAARADLFETLEELADGNDHDQEALSAAAGTADRPDRIAASLRSLAALGREWLARDGAAAKELAMSVGLSAAEIDTAEAAAEALDAAGAGATLEGRVVVNDTPPVNRVEGRLLLEMKAAMRVFARANARNKDIPRLVPGAGTRHVLAPRAKAGKAEPAKPENPGPGTP
jgi:hypothetical protein